MARIRSVKPTIWQDEEFGTASHEARLLFIGLITQADDDGRMVGAARLIWSLIYPWEDFDGEVLEERLCELEDRHLIQRYAKEGKSYIALPSWHKHQKISHRTPSKFPKPTRALMNGSSGFRNGSGVLPEDSPLIGKERKG